LLIIFGSPATPTLHRGHVALRPCLSTGLPFRLYIKSLIYKIEGNKGGRRPTRKRLQESSQERKQKGEY